MKYQLAIVGGGVAGVTAAVYACRKKINTALVASNLKGQTGKAGLIENYPGEVSIEGDVLAKRFENHLRSIPVSLFAGETVNSINKSNNLFILDTGVRKVEAQAVIIATGRNPRTLKVPGEEEFFGKGVSYSAEKDGTDYLEGKEVVVVGGGDSGFKAALSLSERCAKVYILEMLSKSPAEEVSVERAEKKENIEIIFGARMKEIKGEEGVESIVYLKNEEEQTIPVKAVFIEIGSDPVSSFAGDLVDLNEKGEIIINPWTGETKTEGLFAAGDVTNVRDKQITVACGSGVSALVSAYNYLI